MVYVDQLRARPPGRAWPWLTCRLWADGPEELAGVARLLGLSPAWLRHGAGGPPCYWLNRRQRALALVSGACEAAAGRYEAQAEGGKQGCASATFTGR
jgi:hypothetical protein